MCGGKTWMSMWGWGSGSVPLALSLPIASAILWPTSIATTAAQGSHGNLQDRPHEQRLLSCLHDITSSPFQQQSHPKPTNAAGFVQRELRWVPTSWKQADEPTEMVIQFPLNVCCNTLGAASCVQACVLNTKSKTLCVWVCVNNAVSLEGEKQKGKTSGKNSKWKL